MLNFPSQKKKQRKFNSTVLVKVNLSLIILVKNTDVIKYPGRCHIPGISHHLSLETSFLSSYNLENIKINYNYHKVLQNA